MEYRDDIADTICERIADGESLRSICASEGMPTKANVFRWLQANAEFADRYARAREAQADSHADDLADIADTATPENVQVAKLRVDTRKWAASKLKPRVYGDKLDLNHSGGLSVTIASTDADL